MVKKLYLGEFSEEFYKGSLISFMIEEFLLKNIRSFSLDRNFDKTLDEIFNHFVNLLGEDYRDLIESKIKSTAYLFVNNDLEDASSDSFALNHYAVDKFMHEFYNEIGLRKGNLQKRYESFCSTFVKKFSLEKFKNNNKFRQFVTENLYYLTESNTYLTYEDWEQELAKDNNVIEYYKKFASYLARQNDLEELCDKIDWSKDAKSTFKDLYYSLFYQQCRKYSKFTYNNFSLTEIKIAFDYAFKKRDDYSELDKKRYLRVFKKIFGENSKISFKEFELKYEAKLKSIKHGMARDYLLTKKVIKEAFEHCTKRRAKQLEAIREFLVNSGHEQTELEEAMNSIKDFTASDRRDVASVFTFSKGCTLCVLPKNCDSSSFIHEIFHVVSTYNKSEEYYGKSGIGIELDNGRDIYNNLNEIITENYALLTYIGIKNKLRNVGDPSAKINLNQYGYVLPIMTDFLQKYSEIIKEAYFGKSVKSFEDFFGKRVLNKLDREIGKLMHLIDEDYAFEDNLYLVERFVESLQNKALPFDLEIYLGELKNEFDDKVGAQIDVVLECLKNIEQAVSYDVCYNRVKTYN